MKVLQGCVFALTGSFSEDKETFISRLHEHGAEISSNLSRVWNYIFDFQFCFHIINYKRTTHLLCGDGYGSKAVRKAKLLNIPIVNEEFAENAIKTGKLVMPWFEKEESCKFKEIATSSNENKENVFASNTSDQVNVNFNQKPIPNKCSPVSPCNRLSQAKELIIKANKEEQDNNLKEAMACLVKGNYFIRYFRLTFYIQLLQ
jgi:hypothetical protein